MIRPVRNTFRLFQIALLVAILTVLAGCSSLEALRDINENPDHVLRGNPDNTEHVREYLQKILQDPEDREVRAYHRRAYSPDNKKSIFLFHSFYVFFHEGEFEHTLVFTATPKGSEVDGNWMLDADSDLDSFRLFLEGANPWEVEEYVDKNGNPTLHFKNTVTSIIERIDAGFSFFGPASVRNLPWYHMLWVSLAPPPIISLVTVLLMSAKSDNCSSAVLETMQWK